ncbi:MAG: hypothetical protein BGP04_02950 [Rhizobiales bacterium 62-17]|nr:MAG: hypothetical protein BGP04_02950 [Rhizobiales bacterium 62-17]
MRPVKHIGVMFLAMLLPVASMSHQEPAGASTWTAIDWPYPRDGWPAGHAFRCAPSSCGAPAVLTLRVKLGMCNCDTGVRDDLEVDGLSDVDLISSTFVPLAPGTLFQAGALRGRMREYEAVIDGARKRLVGVVLSRGCDVVAASLVTPDRDRRDWTGDFTRLLQNLP